MYTITLTHIQQPRTLMEIVTNSVRTFKDQVYQLGVTILGAVKAMGLGAAFTGFMWVCIATPQLLIFTSIEFLQVYLIGLIVFAAAGALIILPFYILVSYCGRIRRLEEEAQ